jgi:hypothetical protein
MKNTTNGIKTEFKYNPRFHVNCMNKPDQKDVMKSRLELNETRAKMLKHVTAELKHETDMTMLMVIIFTVLFSLPMFVIHPYILIFLALPCAATVLYDVLIVKKYFKYISQACLYVLTNKPRATCYHPYNHMGDNKLRPTTTLHAIRAGEIRHVTAPV